MRRRSCAVKQLAAIVVSCSTLGWVTCDVSGVEGRSAGRVCSAAAGATTACGWCRPQLPMPPAAAHAAAASPTHPHTHLEVLGRDHDAGRRHHLQHVARHALRRRHREEPVQQRDRQVQRLGLQPELVGYLDHPADHDHAHLRGEDLVGAAGGGRGGLEVLGVGAQRRLAAAVAADHGGEVERGGVGGGAVVARRRSGCGMRRVGGVCAGHDAIWRRGLRAEQGRLLLVLLLLLLLLAVAALLLLIAACCGPLITGAAVIFMAGAKITGGLRGVGKGGGRVGFVPNVGVVGFCCGEAALQGKRGMPRRGARARSSPRLRASRCQHDDESTLVLLSGVEQPGGCASGHRSLSPKNPGVQRPRSRCPEPPQPHCTVITIYRSKNVI
jgi:hypothetical protein